MKKRLTTFLFTSVILLSASCNSNKEGNIPLPNKDSFTFYLEMGDSIYAGKKGYRSFEESLNYYNAAQSIADHSKDTLLLAEAMFAKGRVYDAWNKEPQNTIKYFTEATRLFAVLPAYRKRYFYVKHLVAHAYDKIKDSVNAVRVLSELYKEIYPLDTNQKKELPLTAEMALISTEVKNYVLAEKILNNLTRRHWIKNNPETYDFLNHYYLTQSRLDVYYRKLTMPPHLDSLQKVFNSAGNIFDRMYYAENLAQLNAAVNQNEKAFNMLNLAKQYSDSLNNKVDVASMESALLKSELLSEKRQLEYEKKLKNIWLVALWFLIGVICIITLLTIYLQRQKAKYLNLSKRLSVSNNLLDEQVNKVEVLNKEIQHRIKNNLHMVFSLLQMQQRRTPNDETSENLQAAMLRIESIASLHNELLNSNDNPDLTKYVQQLVSAAVNCLAMAKKVMTHIVIEPGKMLPKHYQPLALILNEWITNSVKYAKTNGDFLELAISIRRNNGKIIVEYKDNGIKIEKQPEGLGNQIIHMLCRQLAAELKTTDNPYHYELIFSYE